jgi:hypothetical protein
MYVCVVVVVVVVVGIVVVVTIISDGNPLKYSSNVRMYVIYEYIAFIWVTIISISNFSNG